MDSKNVPMRDPAPDSVSVAAARVLAHVVGYTDHDYVEGRFYGELALAAIDALGRDEPHEDREPAGDVDLLQKIFCGSRTAGC